MAINYWLGSLLLVFTSLIIINTIFTFRIKNSIGARTLSFLSLVIAILSFSYAIELLSFNTQSMLLFNLIRNLMQQLLAPLFFILSYAITKNDKAKSISVGLIIFIIPLLTIIFRLTSSGHSFYLYNFIVENSGYLNVLKSEKGFWYFISSIYNALLYVFAIGIFAKELFLKKNNFVLNIVMICALCIPLISDIIDFVGLSPNGAEEIVKVGIMKNPSTRYH